MTEEVASLDPSAGEERISRIGPLLELYGANCEARELQISLVETDGETVVIRFKGREVAEAYWASLHAGFAPLTNPRGETGGLELLRIAFHVCDEPKTPYRVTLAPTGRCGFGIVEIDGVRVSVEVRPKIHEVDYLRLLQMAGVLPACAPRLSGQAHDSFLLLIAVLYRDALEQLLLEGAGGGLKRMHVTRDEILRGRIRGRLRIPAYMRLFLKGRHQDAPCTFQRLTLDNLPNRSLLWALELTLGLTWGAGSEAVRSEHLRLRALQRCFAGVEREPVSPQDLDRLPALPETFQVYRLTGVLDLAEWIIRHLGAGNVRGDQVGIGFSFTMHEVFERAFAIECARRLVVPLALVRQQSWRFIVKEAVGEFLEGASDEDRYEKSKHFVPDVLLPAEGGLRPVVIDTKWKSSLSQRDQEESPEDDSSLSGELNGAQFEGLKLRNADIFQIISYAYLAYLKALESETIGEQRRAVGVLVYPSTALDAPPLRLVWNPGGSDVGRDSQPPLRLDIYILPWYLADSDDGGLVELGSERLFGWLKALREKGEIDEGETQTKRFRAGVDSLGQVSIESRLYSCRMRVR